MFAKGPAKLRAWGLAALCVLAVAAGTQGAIAAEGTPKPVVGVIDLQRVLSQADAARSVVQQRESYAEVYQQEAAQEEKDLRATDEELARQRAVLSPEAFADKRQEFQERLQTFQKDVQMRRRDLERAFSQAMNKIQGTVIRITDDVAAERGMNLIVYRSQVFLFDPEMDITDIVLERVNKELPNVTMPDPATVSASGKQSGE